MRSLCYLEDRSCEIQVLKAEPEAPFAALPNCRQRSCTCLSSPKRVHLGKYLQSLSCLTHCHDDACSVDSQELHLRRRQISDEVTRISCRVLPLAPFLTLQQSFWLRYVDDKPFCPPAHSTSYLKKEGDGSFARDVTRTYSHDNALFRYPTRPD